MLAGSGVRREVERKEHRTKHEELGEDTLADHVFPDAPVWVKTPSENPISPSFAAPLGLSASQRVLLIPQSLPRACLIRQTETLGGLGQVECVYLCSRIFAYRTQQAT